VAVSEFDTRGEKQDPEFIRNGGFGKHFPTCKGAGDATIVRTCKHPRRIRADYSGKHKCHGKRGLVVVNGEGRVSAGYALAFSPDAMQASTVPRRGTWPALCLAPRGGGGNTYVATWKPRPMAGFLHWRRRSPI
jgi:hypothetical protein